MIVIDWIESLLQGWGFPDGLITLITIIVKMAAILIPLLTAVAYFTYAERKIIGFMQIRIGPNRVGFFGKSLWGLGQPIADAVKLMFKEIVIPTGADKKLFILAPILSMGPALAAWAVIPFNAELVLADIDASLLYIMAITSIGVYGVIVAGWASNSKYAFLGAMRSAAQIVSYETNWAEVKNNIAVVGIDLIDTYDGEEKIYKDLQISLIKDEDEGWKINFWQ